MLLQLPPVLAPLLAGRITFRAAAELRDSGLHPLRGWTGRRVIRKPEGGFADLPPERDQSL